MRILVLPFIALLKIYQKTLSIWISMFVGPKCKYHPTCSHYAIDALETHNLAGLPLIAWRLVRCNPFSHGGVDYVSNKYFENFLKNPQNQRKTAGIGVNKWAA